jgi:hypothetical protein
MNLLIGLSIVGICLLLLKRNYTKRKELKEKDPYDWEKMSKLYYELYQQGKEDFFFEIYPKIAYDYGWKELDFFHLRDKNEYEEEFENKYAKLFFQRVLLYIAIIIGCIYIFSSFQNF